MDTDAPSRTALANLAQTAGSQLLGMLVELQRLVSLCRRDSASLHELFCGTEGAVGGGSANMWTAATKYRQRR